MGCSSNFKVSDCRLQTEGAGSPGVHRMEGRSTALGLVPWMACLSVPKGLQNPVEHGKLKSGARAETVEGKDCGNRELADVTGGHNVSRDGRGCHPQGEQRDDLGLTLCGC